MAAKNDPYKIPDMQTQIPVMENHASKIILRC